MKVDAQQSLQWIARRRSVYPKEFNSAQVSEERITQLLETARFAPTHKLTEPWRFVVFMGKQKADLAEMLYDELMLEKGGSDKVVNKGIRLKDKMKKTSAMIAIVMKRDPQKRIPIDEELWSVASAVQNVQLHASALNIGLYWSTGAGVNTINVRRMLGLEGEDRHMGWLFVGHFEGEKQLVKPRISVNKYVEFRK